MGGCASKPKDLDLGEAPAPREAPAPPQNTETDIAPPQEVKEGETKEEPLIDVSEPAPKNEEVTTETETKLVAEEPVPVEEPAKAVEVVEEKEKKKVAETVAVSEKPGVEAAAPKPEEKSDAPSVQA